ncbi:hypothetical protein AB0A63_27460 [Lentzea sp. NPDC042327]|uniref:hypothetical protein n=1 Tax=Lentzea sp. NPDC042327 TaxID=3154801 RepID=UPI0033D37450
MRHGVDPGPFQQTAHSPSCFEPARTGAGQPVGFRTPCNPHFPTPQTFEEPAKSLRLLSRHRVLIRECATELGMSSGFARLVVRPESDVERLVEGIRDFTRARWTSAHSAHPGEPPLLMHSA